MENHHHHTAGGRARRPEPRPANRHLPGACPYAQPPVGALRFRRPQEHAPWEGVRDCTAFGPRCPQADLASMDFYGKEFYRGLPDDESEDCLYLNIWTPASATAQSRLPVLFWIHGGAFLHGCGSEKEFDGEGFAKKGVILVTINYRVNAFGFFAHPAPGGGGQRKASPATTAFSTRFSPWTGSSRTSPPLGATRTPFTLAGQSAGCMSVQTILSSPLARGMARGAILQKRRGHPGAAHHPREAGAVGGLPAADGPPGRLHPGGAAPSPRGEAAGRRLRRAGPGPELVPPRGRLAAAGHHRRPGGEWRHPRHRHHDWLHRGRHRRGGAAPRGGGPLVREPAEAGPPAGTVERCVDRKLPGDQAGAFHSSELWYEFETLSRGWRPWEEHDWELAEQLSAYWANFVKTGDPNGPGLPPWHPYAGEHKEALVLR